MAFLSRKTLGKTSKGQIKIFFGKSSESELLSLRYAEYCEKEWINLFFHLANRKKRYSDGFQNYAKQRPF